MEQNALMALAAGAVTVAVWSVVFAFVYWILSIIGYWKVFTKAGEPGWKSIIPIYNNYIEIKISWKTKVFWIMVLLLIVYGILSSMQSDGGAGIWGVLASISSIILVITYIMTKYKLAKCFGKGIGFTIGLIIFPAIFQMILGFGSAEYNKTD